MTVGAGGWSLVEDSARIRSASAVRQPDSLEVEIG
jgi:hypothetical protein